MSSTRERLIAAAALIVSVLALATSVDLGRTLIQSLLTAVVSYGTAVLVAAFVLIYRGGSGGFRQIIRATRTVVTASVILALVLYGMGRALWGVIA
ncbi:hypothetical protein ACF07Y_46400 [Streptomyces sp. NPDC016566]|uniref:hypothetical protein n=1 Tax=Streptomyces sp. NPDC016566 TaxID=3364967 RepID=UPI0036F9707F